MVLKFVMIPSHGWHLARTMPPVSILPGTSASSIDKQLNHQESSNISTTQVRSQSRMSISHDKGLLNMPGQNNCFLNSAVQVCLLMHYAINLFVNHHQRSSSHIT